ncbi:hypothetical protein PCANC_10260 [Puccinia coronata f. sp. avenae]|uniref:Uncharacterized protein n=1 Tax=Puccinia coronata f. sp. avenae TaxID=200324 RepID=A0A2N5VQA2_9BASI|nr:hypothetical protein PCANC_10260 [Puccinia coronata f. sp. avenae]
MGSTHDWLLRLKWTSSMYIRWAGGQLLTGVVTLSTNPPPNLTPARQRLAFCRHNDDGMTLAVTPSCSTVSPASIWPRRRCDGCYRHRSLPPSESSDIPS